MEKIISLVGLLFFCLQLSGQKEITEAYIFTTDSKYPLVEFVYGNINYPAKARENGITAVVKVDYTVLKDGRVMVDSSLVITDRVNVDTLNKQRLITVIAYQVQGSFTRKVPKKGTKRYAKFIAKKEKGELMLAKEVARVFTLLPAHQPATASGRPVKRQYTCYVNFNLE